VAITSICYTTLASCESFAQVLDFMMMGLSATIEAIGKEANIKEKHKKFYHKTMAITSICYTTLASCEGFAQVLDFMMTDLNTTIEAIGREANIKEKHNRFYHKVIINKNGHKFSKLLRNIINFNKKIGKLDQSIICLRMLSLEFSK
jgi:uncharacterized protein YlaN (UPF0358 family)